MKLASQPLSFWLFVAFIILFLLQLFPLTGIFLMVAGAAYICGFLLISSMIVLFFEAMADKVPRHMLLVPLLGFAAYYALFLHQNWQIVKLETELQQSNTFDVYAFNSDREQLVTKNAGELVSAYRIPIVFEKNGNSLYGYRSHHILAKDNCDKIRGDFIKTGVSKSSVSYREPAQSGQSFGRLHYRKGVCHLHIPNKPKKAIISVDIQDQQIWKRKTSATEGTYTLLKNDTVLAKYRTASIYRYSIFPLPIIGCALVSSAPSWSCFFQLSKSLYRLKSNPVTLSKELNINPVAVMLGLEKYEDKDFLNFKEFDESSFAITQAKRMTGNPIDKVFAQLDRLMIEPNKKFDPKMERILTRDALNIAERSQSIVQYVEELQKSKPNEVQDLQRKQHLFFALSAWLPDELLRRNSNEIFKSFKEFQQIGSEEELYLRLADVESHVDGLAAWYEEHLQSERFRGLRKFLPAAAICRIGHASSGAVAFMKSEFEKTNEMEKNWNYHDALFLALLEVGERKFVETILSTRPVPDFKWYQSILDGEAASKYGPNNCMAKESISSDWYAPPSLQRIIN